MEKIEWSLELCKQEALKYDRKIDFLKACGQAYRIAYKKGWFDDVCSHMVGIIKPYNYWNKENCAVEAIKYRYKKDFQKNSPSCYVISSRNGWIDDICNHMSSLGNIQKRYIYKVLFPDGCVYIGLTCNPESRFSSHLTNEKSAVYQHIVGSNSKPIFKLFNSILYPKEDAAELEDLIIKEYKSLGKCVLNKIKAGGLGGGKVKWTFETCKEEALKYDKKKEFILNSENAYNACLKNKWKELLCSHMIDAKKPNNYWTKEELRKEALKYNSKKEFRENSRTPYATAYRIGVLGEICNHMIETKRVKGHWAYKNCKIESKKYTSRSEFKTSSSGAYDSARKNKWLEEFFPK